VNTVLSVATVIAIFAIPTAGLRLQVGQNGLVNFGMAAYFGVGAYGYALLTLPANNAIGSQSIGFHMNSAIAIVMTLAIVGVLSAISGWLILHLDATNFALITFTYLVLMGLLLVGDSTFADGSQGVSNIRMPFYSALSSSNLLYTASLCAISIGVLLVVVVLLRRLDQSPFGTVARWLRDDSFGCRSAGVFDRRIRLKAFVIGCIVAGVGGIIYSWYVSSAAPSDFTITVTFSMFIAMAIGGTRSYLGAVLGAVLLFGLQQGLGFISLPPAIASRVAYLEEVPIGLVLILILRFRPEGLLRGRKHSFGVAS